MKGSSLPLDPLEVLSAQAFCRVADARLSHGNRVRLLRDGPQTFAAWLDAIAGAKRTVHLENYILQEDWIGRRFADALIAAARRGAQCQVIYDWMGCLLRTSAGFWKELRAAGVLVREYNPPRVADPLRWISRDHRKVLVVDGEVAFTGGLCIGHDWMGDAEKNIPPWRDTAIEIHGPAVAQIDAAFADSWECAGSRHYVAVELPVANEPGPDDGADGVTISVIAGRPDVMGLYRLEQLVADMAQRTLWLTDGYFVATAGYVRSLAAAARAGVDVRLLVPGSSNWPVVGALSKSAYRPLLQAGVRVFEWSGPMLHAKTAVADSVWTRIGSSNSNLASWVTNRELDVTVKDHALAQAMERMFEEDIAQSREVVLAMGRTGIVRPVAPEPLAPPGGGPAVGRALSGAIGLGSALTASLSRRRRMYPEEALVVLSGAAVLLALGIVAVLLPRVIAGIVALAALWPGVVFLVRGIRLWREDRSGGGD